VHDRRIDGETYVFGNAGALFMTAMTWFDHETRSIWSQPWGRAISGPLKGVQLFLLPSKVTTWGSWQREHPATLVMVNDVNRLRPGFRQGFDQDFVIGLLLAGQAKAYRFTDVAANEVINDAMGDYPVLVWAKEDNFQAYLRKVGHRTLTFQLEGEQLVDAETGSSWDIGRGLATAGPLRGEALQAIPGSTAYDWAWLDFYPDTDFYTP
jgi:hypothetical protein